MLFIGEQAALIEIQKSKTEYLIGDEIFATIPTKILNRVSITANWNRALRYLNQKNLSFNHLGFVLIRFELYLKDDLVICFSKNSFEQKILNQLKFQKEFLNEIFAFRNRNYQSFALKNFPQNLDLEVVNHLNVDLNRCWISDQFCVKGQKYKILFKKSSIFKVEKTRVGQVIYYSNFDFGDWDLVDLKTGNFYQEGKYQLNVDVCLTLATENQKMKNCFLNNLVESIQESNELPFHHKNWHLFNITNDKRFLVSELNQIFAHQNFDAGLIYLESLFKELQNSYFSFLFSQMETKMVFFKFAHSLSEKNKLKKLISRYGILSSQDQEKNQIMSHSSNEGKIIHS